MDIFSKYDIVAYGNYPLTNILRKVSPIKAIIDKVNVLYDYVIKEGERADTIAHDYYGNSDYAWLIYITNNIFDPYYQWPLSANQFYNYIVQKYGDYYQTQIDILHYAKDGEDFTISPLTHSKWTPEQRIGWRPVTIWEWENEINENKRKIKLIANTHIDLVNRQIMEFFENI